MSSAGGTVRRYSHVAIGFHWLIAALILLNLFLGWRMNRVTGLDKFSLFQTHKSVGMTILALSVLRLLWRLAHPAPPYPASMQRWERVSATTLHWTFYALMLIMPITGWIVVSASPLNIPTLLYKTIPLPHIGVVHDLPIGTRHAIENNVGSGHVVLAYTFGLLILLHVAAALKHQFVQRDHVLARMMPGRKDLPPPEKDLPPPE